MTNHQMSDKVMNNFRDLENTEIYRTLNAPYYTLAQASRLCGVSKGRASRWLRGYDYTYDVAGETRSRSQHSIVERVFDQGSASVSFLELIDLLFVKRFLDNNYTLQKIRKVFNEARRYLSTPHFASAKFYIFGKETILDDTREQGGSGDLLALFSGGQQAMREIVNPIGLTIDFEDITEFGLAERWYPQGKKGHIIVDPKISFGQPTIIGTRITTDNIFDLYLGENKETHTVSKWFGLPAAQINSAVAFEQSIYA